MKCFRINKKILYFLIALGFLLFFLFLNTLPAMAQGDYQPLAPLPQIQQPEGTNFTPYVTGWAQLLIGVAGGLAVIVIIIGGLQYITAGDSESRTADAKERIWKALMGLVLAVASWLILFTINPNLLNTQIGIKPVDIPKPPPPSSPQTPQEYCQAMGLEPGTWWVQKRQGEPKFEIGSGGYEVGVCITPTSFVELLGGPLPGPDQTACINYINDNNLPTKLEHPECTLYSCYQCF